MSASSYKQLLKSVGFQSFLWTQFLGAYNDNVYKILVSLLAVEIGAKNGKGSAGTLPSPSSSSRSILLDAVEE